MHIVCYKVNGIKLTSINGITLTSTIEITLMSINGFTLTSMKEITLMSINGITDINKGIYLELPDSHVKTR